MSTNCNTASLETYGNNQPWTLNEVYHLYRRAAFGISPEDAKLVLQKTPEEAVNDLVNNALNLPLTEKPDEANDYSVDAITNKEFRDGWRYKMFRNLNENGLRSRLLLFWTNHFVAEYINYKCPSYWYEYINIIERNSLGNLKTFVHEIGLSSAMLVYLNGNQNKENLPNENYARELYELFTLGEGIGYTQTDIEETAKALTGYTRRESRCAPITFRESHFNATDKTIFGQTGNWGYDDVINILFDERPAEIAQHIVKKLYRHFVHPVLPEDAIIDELATDLQNENFELEPVLRKLLKSEHFFNKQSQSVIIKSPLDILITMYNDFMMPFPERGEEVIADRFHAWSLNMGQEFFNPPNVAGWQEDRDWISSPALLFRWKYPTTILNKLYSAYDRELFRNLAISILDDPEEQDAGVICKKIVDHYLPNSDLSDLDYENALETFISNVPSNYFEDGTWTIYFSKFPLQMRNLLIHITKQPEFQLK